jgi:hypothetical protein
MFVGAGVLAAGAAAAWFFWPKGARAGARTTHVEPVVGAGYLGVGGTF